LKLDIAIDCEFTPVLKIDFAEEEVVVSPVGISF